MKSFPYDIPKLGSWPGSGKDSSARISKEKKRQITGTFARKDRVREEAQKCGFNSRVSLKHYHKHWGELDNSQFHSLRLAPAAHAAYCHSDTTYKVKFGWFSKSSDWHMRLWFILRSRQTANWLGTRAVGPSGWIKCSWKQDSEASIWKQEEWERGVEKSLQWGTS